MPTKKILRGSEADCSDFYNYAERVRNISIIHPPYSKITYAMRVEDDNSITVVAAMLDGDVEFFVDIEIPSLEIEYLESHLTEIFKYNEDVLKVSVSKEIGLTETLCSIKVETNYKNEEYLEDVLYKIDSELEDNIYNWTETDYKSEVDPDSSTYKIELKLSIKN